MNKVWPRLNHLAPEEGGGDPLTASVTLLGGDISPPPPLFLVLRGRRAESVTQPALHQALIQVVTAVGPQRERPAAAAGQALLLREPPSALGHHPIPSAIFTTLLLLPRISRTWGPPTKYIHCISTSRRTTSAS